MSDDSAPARMPPSLRDRAHAFVGRVFAAAGTASLRARVDGLMAEVVEQLADDDQAQGITCCRSLGTSRRFVMARILARFGELPSGMDRADLSDCIGFLTDWRRALRAGRAD